MKKSFTSSPASHKGKRRDGHARNVWSLGFASFFNDVGSEMIVPLLPFYITALGGSGVAIGLASGLREGLSSLFKIFGGWLSDRTGKRKAFIFLGYFLSTIFKFFIGFASAWQSVIAFVSLERLGKFRDAPRDAVISYSKKVTGRNFGIVQMLDVVGGILGTLLVLLLFWKLNFEIKKIIFIAAGISILSLLPLFFVREPRLKAIKRSLYRSLHDLNPRLKYFILVSSVFAFANFGLYMFMILIAQKATNNFVTPIFFYILFNIAYAVFLIPFGSLSDKIGRKSILFVGYLLFLIVALGFVYYSNIFHIAILFALYGIVYALTYSSQRALVSDLSKEMKGTAFGTFHTATGFAGILGGLTAGILWDFNPKVMFMYLSFVAFVSLILLCFVKDGWRR
ncbi:MFS transporter [Candidatus Pacearchaeota archaeon]|nr:MFS transporter [Candidatus Pacearchaeota archaeon]